MVYIFSTFLFFFFVVEHNTNGIPDTKFTRSRGINKMNRVSRERRSTANHLRFLSIDSLGVVFIFLMMMFVR